MESTFNRILRDLLDSRLSHTQASIKLVLHINLGVSFLHSFLFGKLLLSCCLVLGGEASARDKETVEE